MMKYNRLHILFFICAVFLAGCEMYHPSYMSESRLEVHEELHTQNFDTQSFDPGSVAQHYNRYGDGVMYLTVTYDPESKTNTAMTAGEEASKFVKILRKNGVKNIESGILPVKESGSISKVFVGYQSYGAHAPEDCALMPGMEETNAEADLEYRLGCSVDTIFARQISRPSDLAGKAKKQSTTDGRRSVSILERYRSGRQNESLDGESASGE